VLSYGDLYRLAAQGESLLRDRLRPGDRVMLFQQDSIDFMVAFFSGLLARVALIGPRRPKIQVKPCKEFWPRACSGHGVVRGCE
jgi:hypothetical protein